MSAILAKLRLRRGGPDGVTADQTAPAPTGTVPRTRFGAWLGRPMTSFHLIIAVAALLVTLGLIMVLSASGVHSYDEDGSPWVIFAKQVLWTIVGLVAFYAALRMPVNLMRRLAFPGFAFTIVLLILVLIPGIGKEANGSRGWFVVAGFSMQPSELAKIAFAIWGAHLLAARRLEHASLREMLFPLVPAAVLALFLIVLQPDLGQTVSLSIILLGLLWYAGLPLRVFLSSLAAAMMAGAALAVSEGYRSDRVQSWLNPGADTQGSGYQARQARYALANGGVFGDGLGQGTAKWNYLPNAHNDFIFAIIGEELGLVGAVGLLLLFGLFAYTGMRIARRSADPFLRLLTATTTLWVLGQVFINVGYVVGLLPVTGLQLPLISAGGTSTATTLLMMGVITNAARHEPEAVAALRAGRDDPVNRLLRLPLPEPYSPTRLESARDRLRRRSKAQAASPSRSPTRSRKTKPKPKGKAKPERASAKDDRRRTAHAADRPVRRSGHHGGRQPPTGPSGSLIGRPALRVNNPAISAREQERSDRGISVVLAGGGTAGHVEPAMAVADALMALDPRIRITALGTERGLETRLVPERGYHLELITPVPLPRKPSGDLIRLPMRVRRAVRQTRAVLDDVEADVVIGFGGYVALPAYLAARGGVRRRRVPVVIHEANASAGWANRVGARSARRVLSAVPNPGLRDVEVVGVPVRATITSLDRAALRAEARARFGFSDDARVLLVFGGSQGAQSINRAVAAAAEDLAAAGVSVLHAHGPKNVLDLREPGARRSAVRRRALPERDGPRLRRRRPGHLPVRRDHGRRGERRRPARGVRPAADRQWRAATQRAARRRRGRRPDRRRRRPDPGVRRRNRRRTAR